MRGVRGYTLWELLCALGIAGLLVGLGAPALSDFLLDGRRTADVNALVLAVQLARSEAAKRGRPVIVCPTADHVRCGGAFGLASRSISTRAPSEPSSYFGKFTVVNCGENDSSHG